MRTLLNQSRVVIELAFAVSVISLLAACGGHGEGDGEGGATMPATTGILQSLTITPAASSVAACTPLQLTATGNYSDNTTLNVTNYVIWQVDPAQSSVAMANAFNGQVLGISAGSATVYAWTGSIATSAVVNVSGGSLNALAITPASATLGVGGSQSYAAIATCSNGSTQDVSRMNIWSSSAPSVASISVTGMATALATGSSVISATAGNVAASSVLNVQ
jgi:hypothetical protein